MLKRAKSFITGEKLKRNTQNEELALPESAHLGRQDFSIKSDLVLRSNSMKRRTAETKANLQQRTTNCHVKNQPDQKRYSLDINNYQKSELAQSSENITFRPRRNSNTVNPPPRSISTLGNIYKSTSRRNCDEIEEERGRETTVEKGRKIMEKGRETVEMMREKSRERNRETARDRNGESSRDRNGAISRDRNREKSREIHREKSRDRYSEKSREKLREKPKQTLKPELKETVQKDTLFRRSKSFILGSRKKNVESIPREEMFHYINFKK